MELNGWLHVLAALTWDKMLLLPSVRSRGGYERWWLFLPKMEFRLSSRPARSLVSIPTELSRLLRSKTKCRIDRRWYISDVGTELETCWLQRTQREITTYYGIFYRSFDTWRGKRNSDNAFYWIWRSVSYYMETRQVEKIRFYCTS
jgi:hypothetical protein